MYLIILIEMWAEGGTKAKQPGINSIHWEPKLGAELFACITVFPSRVAL